MALRTLILDNSFSTFLLPEGSLTRRWCGEPVEVVPASRTRPPSPDSFDCLILTGSESSILAEDEWIHRQMDFVSEVIEKDKPVLGICFGHQLIARALWGNDHVRRAPVPEFGWRLVKLDTEDPLFAGLPAEGRLFCSHFYEVVDPPPGVAVTASSEICGVHAFRLPDRPVWGVQFHPEVDKFYGLLLLFYFGALKRKISVDMAQAWRDAREAVFAQTLFLNFRRAAG